VRQLRAADRAEVVRHESQSRLVRVLTVAVWIGAAISWVALCHKIGRESKLGWDLLTPWRAEKLFVHGGPPYSVSAFVYPPSCLVLLAPLAWLDSHQLTVGGLFATALVACASVLVTARAIGVNLFGPVTAVTVLLLSLAGAMRGEMPLENVSVLEFLAFALFLLFAIRGRWMAAAIVIGIAVAIKPLLLAILIVFVLSRKWKALGVAIGIPVALNLLSLAFLSDPRQVLSRLPSLFDRTGSGVVYNSAWVDVARLLGLPEGVTVLLRVVTLGLVLVATWLAWTRLTDVRLRIIVSSSVLLIGSFLAGTLSEYHFMLTLVPLFMTIVIVGSPVRSVLALIGMVWIMDDFGPPRSWIELSDNGRDTVFRAIGMGLVLISFIVTLARRRVTGDRDHDEPSAAAVEIPIDLVAPVAQLSTTSGS
jgi:arabinofuranan 3-O-arabinosyltransferase